MLIPSAQTLEPIRKVPARKEIFGLTEYYGFLKHCRLLRSIDHSWWRPEREHSVDIHNYAGTGDGVGDC